MEILVYGKKHEEYVQYGKCSCECEFIAERGEYDLEPNLEGAEFIAKCPCCNRRVSLSIKSKSFCDKRKPDYWRDN